MTALAQPLDFGFVALRRWIRRLPLLVGITALALFHAHLLVQRLADGSLFRPAVAGQWLASAALMLWLVRLRRRGLSLLAGRRAAAFWVLVLLLHAIAAVPGGEAVPGPDGKPLLLLVPAGLALLSAALLAALARHGRNTRSPLVQWAPRPRASIRPPGRRASRCIPRAPPRD